MAPETVTVITLTYRRPNDLKDALPLLVEALDDHPSAELLVVDNDVTPSAAGIVQGYGDHRVRYVHEPKPGIAAARNRGLKETRHRDIVVFIDDDERPHPGWLRALLDVHRSTGAEAVAGPVLSEFDGELDPWISAGRFFERLRHPTGTPVDVAATNNLLLDVAFVAARALRFDEEFGLSGGSDSVFTRQLRQAGGRILWCDEAIVTDAVPASRATREWVLKRAFRMGNTEARARIYTATGPARLKERALALGRGAARIVGGAAEWLRGAGTSSLAHRARGMRTIRRGLGMASAAFGYTRFEYRRPSAPGVQPKGGAA